MIGKKRISDVLEQVQALEGPVLSMYLDANPAHDKTPDELLIRAKSTMDGLDVSREVEDAVTAVLKNDPPRAPVLGVFVQDGSLDTRLVPIPVDLPVEDPQTGRGYARLGRPYVTPLLAALDETEHFLVLAVGRDEWRMYEATPVSIDLVERSKRSPTAGELDRMDNSSQVASVHTPDRGDASRDIHQASLDAARDEFFRAAWAEVELRRRDGGPGQVVLMGPDEDRAAAMALLSETEQTRVVAQLGGFAQQDPSPGQVLEQVSPQLERTRKLRQSALVDEIEAHGVTGLVDVLEAWQTGRVSAVVVPWRADQTVYVDPPSGYVATTEQGARKVSGQRPEPMTVEDVVGRLAAEFDVRLEFVRDDLSARVSGPLGGLGAVLRW